jgi:hypothetical protein
MEYRGSFYIATSKGYRSKAEVVNPPNPGHALSFKVITGNYVTGKKLSPSMVQDGSITIGNENGDATLLFADQ